MLCNIMFHSIMIVQRGKEDISNNEERQKLAGMNLLFYGPPGTGKSELARYIAGTLNRELICKRSSDLLDPYVGMTEQKLAQAFFEIETQEAVLVMDEADSVLASRDRAHHTRGSKLHE